ncbi:T6SS effector amidase Tae4 family protein [Commensalibacter nepenthis]|uniref:T6SS effector amidase Tae4 family protein n=1 Tax=Commensalibacter nepenthis TaxID=3043872 RepID=A0ABT6Q6Q1_9PROT|nr:T6SS effector amidase Tae4 family protein [Commensalibacter sp. TBRC 10068]MDI2112565.1 T6SS effector amidase Tae4 family protein [Commensalibacter sp. TBRC 10068]
MNNGLAADRYLYSHPHTLCVRFSDLWNNAETGNPVPEYEYQCAIRLSLTLHRVGINMRSFSQKTVKPALGRQTLGRIIIDGIPVATRADEMAIWLQQYPFCGLGKPEYITGKGWKKKVYNRTGIIAFSNYWGKNQIGGHIDLWNKTRFPYPSPSFSIDGTLGILANFSRFAFGGWGLYEGGYYYGYGFLPNLADSKRILFFEVK